MVVEEKGFLLFGMGELESEKLCVSVSRWWTAMLWPSHRCTEAIFSAGPHPH